uniref:Hematopoietic cell signal transducer n=1 Tax=Scleropages formosus TaxID=113540 RepID=A0A8C9R3E5_SCLFO
MKSSFYRSGKVYFLDGSFRLRDAIQSEMEKCLPTPTRPTAAAQRLQTAQVAQRHFSRADGPRASLSERTQEMANNAVFTFLTVCLLALNVAKGSPDLDTPTCYRIEPATMVGVVIGDMALTVLMVIVAYQCASRRRRQKEEADKVYMNVRANCKVRQIDDKSEKSKPTFHKY